MRREGVELLSREGLQVRSYAFKVETRAERERRQLADRMTAEQRDLNRRFLDALREFLGLAPLTDVYARARLA